MDGSGAGPVPQAPRVQLPLTRTGAPTCAPSRSDEQPDRVVRGDAGQDGHAGNGRARRGERRGISVRVIEVTWAAPSPLLSAKAPTTAVTPRPTRSFLRKPVLMVASRALGRDPGANASPTRLGRLGSRFDSAAPASLLAEPVPRGSAPRLGDGRRVPCPSHVRHRGHRRRAPVDRPLGDRRHRLLRGHVRRRHRPHREVDRSERVRGRRAHGPLRVHLRRRLHPRRPRARPTDPVAGRPRGTSPAMPAC